MQSRDFNHRRRRRSSATCTSKRFRTFVRDGSHLETDYGQRVLCVSGSSALSLLHGPSNGSMMTLATTRRTLDRFYLRGVFRLSRTAVPRYETFLGSGLNTRTRAQSHDRGSKYPVRTIPSSQFGHRPGLHFVYMLGRNSGNHEPALDFPREGGANSRTRSLWMSKDLTCVGLKPTLKPYKPYLSAAVTDRRPMVIVNTLVRYICSWAVILRRESPGLLTNRTQLSCCPLFQPT